MKASQTNEQEEETLIWNEADDINEEDKDDKHIFSINHFYNIRNDGPSLSHASKIYIYFPQTNFQNVLKLNSLKLQQKDCTKSKDNTQSVPNIDDDDDDDETKVLSLIHRHV